MIFIVGIGCSKDFLTEKPLAVIAPDNLYVDKKGFEAGLYGLYNLCPFIDFNRYKRLLT